MDSWDRWASAWTVNLKNDSISWEGRVSLIACQLQNICCLSSFPFLKNVVQSFSLFNGRHVLEKNLDLIDGYKVVANAFNGGYYLQGCGWNQSWLAATCSLVDGMCPSIMLAENSAASAFNFVVLLNEFKAEEGRYFPTNVGFQGRERDNDCQTFKRAKFIFFSQCLKEQKCEVKC